MGLYFVFVVVVKIEYCGYGCLLSLKLWKHSLFYN